MGDTPGERMQRNLEEFGEDEFRRRLFAGSYGPRHSSDYGLGLAILEELRENRERERHVAANAIAEDGAKASWWTARWTFGICVATALLLLVTWCQG